eukprot:TRINITY_DN1601_c0_g1_i1.p1 TRINITY_DN1601_c0_g1~~TRINITY_DN1601_c0_g1_i1.p1  ORF type:complete len:191 (-),score=38.81 TRINITY_DN1601_c0_g1_i1:31-603(-)
MCIRDSINAEYMGKTHQLQIKDRFGEPWAYVLKRVMQFGKDLDSAIDILKNSKRTCEIFLGLGSAKNNQFRAITYNQTNLEVFDDKNCTVCGSDETHPQIDGVVYLDKFWQPSKNQCLGKLLSENNGKIDAEVLFREVAGYHQTGDSQVAVFDFKRSIVYVSYSEFGTGEPAYNRRPFIVDMNYFFNLEI